MYTHQLRLDTAPFNSIAAGIKTIESRLYDEKRQRIQIGDVIEFTHREASNETISVKVIGLLRYGTFHDLFSHNDPAKFGGDSPMQLINQVNEIYPADDQRRYGVVGIEFEVMNIQC